MLSEPRRKVKWTLNPRGNTWSKDETKYGYKMLTKMGWKKGKGLGKNEDGDVEHIKVTYKNDKKGIGCASTADDNWIAHQEEFNSVLTTLNEIFQKQQNTDTSNESEPHSIKITNARLHKRFIKGKDINNYSTHDLNAILGNKKETDQGNIKIKTVNPICDNDKELISENHSGLKTFNSGKSIQEYFASKLANRKVNMKEKSSDTEKDSSEHENVLDCQSINNTDASILPSVIHHLTEFETISKRKKKKKKSKKKFVNCNKKEQSGENSKLITDEEPIKKISPTNTLIQNSNNELSSQFHHKGKRKYSQVDNENNCISNKSFENHKQSNSDKKCKLAGINVKNISIDIKTMNRYVAIQQLKDCYNFPTSQSLLMIQRYENLQENLKGSTIEKTNFFSIPGYGNNC